MKIISYALIIAALFTAAFSQAKPNKIIIIEDARYGMGDVLNTNDVTDAFYNHSGNRWMNKLFGDPQPGHGPKTLAMRWRVIDGDQYEKVGRYLDNLGIESKSYDFSEHDDKDDPINVEILSSTGRTGSASSARFIR